MTVTILKPVRLEVIAPIFQGLGICTSCELVLSEAGVGENPRERALDEYPQEWQEDTQRLTDWVYDLAGRYGEQILIKVIDCSKAFATGCGAIPPLSLRARRRSLAGSGSNWRRHWQPR
jgi:hypothetical protein